MRELVEGEKARRAFWRKRWQSVGSAFRKVLLCFFFFNIVPMWKIMGVSEASILYIYIYKLALCWCDAQFN